MGKKKKRVLRDMTLYLSGWSDTSSAEFEAIRVSEWVRERAG